MEQKESAENKKPTAAPVKKPSKLPSKSISFSSQTNSKNGKAGNVTVNKSKKGGVNLMKKLSGM